MSISTTKFDSEPLKSILQEMYLTIKPIRTFRITTGTLVLEYICVFVLGC